MDWLLGRNQEPSKEDMMLAMLDAQGKVIAGLVAEVENLNILLQSHLNTETDLNVEGKSLHVDTEEKSVEVKMPIPLHTQHINDIDDVFHMELDEFIKGCCITEESDDDTEDTEHTEVD